MGAFLFPSHFRGVMRVASVWLVVGQRAENALRSALTLARSPRALPSHHSGAVPSHTATPSAPPPPVSWHRPLASALTALTRHERRRKEHRSQPQWSRNGNGNPAGQKAAMNATRLPAAQCGRGAVAQTNCRLVALDSSSGLHVCRYRVLHPFCVCFARTHADALLLCRLPFVAPLRFPSQLSNADNTCATLVVMGEDHTLGNAFRYVLAKNKEVDFVGYSIPHPSEMKMNMRVQTKSQIHTMRSRRSRNRAAMPRMPILLLHRRAMLCFMGARASRQRVVCSGRQASAVQTARPARASTHRPCSVSLSVVMFVCSCWRERCAG